MPRDEVKELCGDVGHVFDRHFFQRTFPKSGRLWQQHNLAGKALRHLQFEGRLPNVIMDLNQVKHGEGMGFTVEPSSTEPHWPWCWMELVAQLDEASLSTLFPEPHSRITGCEFVLGPRGPSGWKIFYFALSFEAGNGWSLHPEWSGRKFNAYACVPRREQDHAPDNRSHMYVEAGGAPILKFKEYRNNDEKVVLKFSENGPGQDHPPLPYNWPGAQYEFPGNTAPPEPIQPKRGPVQMPAKTSPPHASAGPPTKPPPRALTPRTVQALANGPTQKAPPELPEHVGLIYKPLPVRTVSPRIISHEVSPSNPQEGKKAPPSLPSTSSSPAYSHTESFPFFQFSSAHPNGPVARPKRINADHPPPPPVEEPPPVSPWRLKAGDRDLSPDRPKPAVAAGAVPRPQAPAALRGPNLTQSELVAKCREIPEDLTREELGARAAEILQEVGAPPKAPPAHLVGTQPLDFSLHDAAVAASSAARADQLYVPGRTVPCKECGQHLVPARYQPVKVKHNPRKGTPALEKRVIIPDVIHEATESSHGSSEFSDGSSDSSCWPPVDEDSEFSDCYSPSDAPVDGDSASPDGPVDVVVEAVLCSGTEERSETCSDCTWRSEVQSVPEEAAPPTGTYWERGNARVYDTLDTRRG